MLHVLIHVTFYRSEGLYHRSKDMKYDLGFTVMRRESRRNCVNALSDLHLGKIEELIKRQQRKVIAEL